MMYIGSFGPWSPLSYVTLFLVVYFSSGPKVILDSIFFYLYPGRLLMIAKQCIGVVRYLLGIRKLWWNFFESDIVNFNTIWSMNQWRMYYILLDFENHQVVFDHLEVSVMGQEDYSRAIEGKVISYLRARRLIPKGGISIIIWLELKVLT